MLIPAQQVWFISRSGEFDTNPFFYPKAIVTWANDKTVFVLIGGERRLVPLRLSGDPIPAGDYCELVA